MEIGVLDDIEDSGYYTSRRARFSAGIGARKLGYNLTVLPPGKAQCPFHAHRGEEEMFLILEGEGELRFGAQRYPLRPHDVIACPTGGPEVAHQIINTGTTDLRYLALSNQVDEKVCEYPDPKSLGVFALEAKNPAVRRIRLARPDVGYSAPRSLEPLAPLPPPTA